MATVRVIELIDNLLLRLDAFENDAQALHSNTAPREVVTAPNQKEEKVKKQKKGQKAKAEAIEATVDPFLAADLRIGQVIAVEPVKDSEKLWLCQVDVGEEKPRQVVAGLQQYIPRETMQNLFVTTVCNLKPAKLAGHVSEAMILAASCDGETRIVKPVQPPEGSHPGQKVYSGEVDASAHGVPAKILKSKIWSNVLERLKVIGNEPKYDGKRLCTVSGACFIDGSIPDNSPIS